MKRAFWWMRFPARAAVAVATALTFGCAAAEDIGDEPRYSGPPAEPSPIDMGVPGEDAVSGGGSAGDMGATSAGAGHGMPGAAGTAGTMADHGGVGVGGGDVIDEADGTDVGGAFIDEVDGTDVAGDPLLDGDLGRGDGHDVIAIGDSWMNLGSVGIQQSLLAASGQPYRVYGVPGTRLLDEAIPGQYQQARFENPDIKTIVMTGGGNDILMNPLVLFDCPMLGAMCRSVIDSIGARYLELAAQAAADGVEDAIIVVYGRGTPLGAAPINYVHESIVQAIAPACESSGMRCHIVDADAVAGGVMQLRDGIHPTNANYDLLGRYIHDLMVIEGMRR